MSYEYQLVRASLREHRNGEKKIEYLFDANGRRYRFSRYTRIETGRTMYKILGSKLNTLLSWTDDDGFTYMDISGESFRMLESLIFDEFGVTMPKLS